jgi:hypothetical protein
LACPAGRYDRAGVQFACPVVRNERTGWTKINVDKINVDKIIVDKIIVDKIIVDK